MRDIREKNWFWIENDLVDRSDIGAMEKLIYMILARYADNSGRCFPSLDKMKEITGIKDYRTIVKYINKLEEKELLTIEKRKGKSNVYCLKNVNEVPTKNVGAKNVDTEKVPTKNVGQVPTNFAGRVPTKNVGLKKHNEKNPFKKTQYINPPIIPQGGNSSEKSQEEKTEKHTEEINTVILYLNQKVRSSIKLNNKSVRKLIEARLNDGNTVGDLMAVINDKCNQWLNSEKMRRYLVPATLFRKSNFDKYLQELEVIEKNSGYEHLFLDDDDDDSVISDEFFGGVEW